MATPDDFTHATLPRLDTRVLRLGVSGTHGLTAADVEHAADRGVNLWFWTARSKAVTPGLRQILRQDREGHVVAAMSPVTLTARGIRRRVERLRRLLEVDWLDLYLLSWLGVSSRFSPAIQEALVRLREDGVVRAVGTSIHDRPRAGALAQDSVLDALMIRYNAKHPGAEQDIFPHLAARDPLIIAYTATSWRQLLRPLGIDMPPWPGPVATGDAPPPPLTAALCYRFALTSPHVHAALTAPADRAQLDANLDALAAGPLDGAEEAWVRDYGRQVKRRRPRSYL